MNNTLETWIPEGIGETNFVFEVGQLQKHLSQIPDPRQPRGIRYSLPVLLSMLVLAKLCGEDKLSGMAEWLRLRERQLTALGLERRTLPHVTTYSRVLADLDLEHMETVLGEFFQEQSITGVVSLDGKTLGGLFQQGKLKVSIYWQLMRLRRAWSCIKWRLPAKQMKLLSRRNCIKRASKASASSHRKTRPNVSWEGIPFAKSRKRLSHSSFATP